MLEKLVTLKGTRIVSAGQAVTVPTVAVAPWEYALEANNTITNNITFILFI